MPGPSGESRSATRSSIASLEMSMSDREIGRRRLRWAARSPAVRATGAMAAREGAPHAPARTIIGVVPWSEGAADVPPMAAGTDYRFFTAAEQAFIEPAVDRLIPADPARPERHRGRRAALPRPPAGRPVRPRRSLLPRRPLAEGHAGAGLQSRFTPAQFYRARHRRDRRATSARQVQRQGLQASLPRTTRTRC